MAEKIYAFIDVETTGLNTHENGETRVNRLLQVYVELLDENLDYLDSMNLEIPFGGEVIKDMGAYVINMHSSTGLIERNYDSNISLNNYYRELRSAEKELIKMAIKCNAKLIPCGNNIQFDLTVLQRNMPEFYSHLNYSGIDVSSVRRAIGFVKDGFSDIIYDLKGSNHNAEVDIKECIKEFKLYVKLLNNLKDIIDEDYLRENFSKDNISID